MHRQFVMGYREERQRVEDQIYEANNGYKTEIAEHYRVLREQGTPAITFKDYLMHRDRAPEAPVTEPLDQPMSLQGNRYAEEGLLAVVMDNPRAVAVLKELNTEEFITPINRRIAETILTLDDHGLPFHAIDVEASLKEQGAPQQANWDSSMPMGDRDRTEYGLQHWEKYAGVYENAQYFAGEVRQQANAYKTEQAYEWGASMIRGGYHSPDGISSEYTSMVHQQVQEKIDKLPPPLYQAPAKVNAMNYAESQTTGALTNNRVLTASRAR